MRGHLWTVLPNLLDRWRAPRGGGVEWSTQVADERFGSIRISGILDEVLEARALVIVVHGMGSSAEASYVVRTANAARARGLSVLRLNLRGAMQSGEDIYNAGLVEDLKAAVDSPEFRHYESIHAIGFSLGGHMVLRYALDPDPRVRSVVAVCSPLNLRTSRDHIDLLPQTVYRRHLLAGLRSGASAVELRRGVSLAGKDLAAIRSIGEWDEKVVAPRFGFRDASHYYDQASVGPYMSDLAVPSLLVFADRDPMVTPRDVRPSLGALPAHSRVRWFAGGHVYFHKNNSRVLNEILHWSEEQG